MFAILAANLPNQQQVMQQMRFEFGEPDPGLWWKIPVVLTLLAIALALVWLLGRLERNRIERQLRPQPLRLFLRLLLRCKVPYPEIWRLWRMVRFLDIQHPTTLLISPTLYDKAVEAYCTRAHFAARRRSLTTIRERLFGEDFLSTPESA